MEQNLALYCVQLLGENAAKISNFASYLRSVFRTDTDPTTLEVAAATLGHLVQTGGALTADVVEYEVSHQLHVPQVNQGCWHPSPLQTANSSNSSIECEVQMPL